MQLHYENWRDTHLEEALDHSPRYICSKHRLKRNYDLLRIWRANRASRDTHLYYSNDLENNKIENLGKALSMKHLRKIKLEDNPGLKEENSESYIKLLEII